MKTAKEYFDEYAVSHQNEINQTIHYICVPVIFFSVIGLLMSIITTFLEKLLDLFNPISENWPVVFGLVASLFYMRLGFWYFIKMIFVLLICIISNFYLANQTNLLYTSITIFILDWIGQFYGHKIEGKKPSFLKDLEFLLIGPLWINQKLGKKK